MSACVRVTALLTDAAAQLAASSSTPRLDAEVLLAYVLGKSRSYLYAWPEQILRGDSTRCFKALLARRLCGEPIAYLIGAREFWSLELATHAAVLIPRPETELLVELALTRIPLDQPALIADLGTGSGAIALALASERPWARIIATDISQAALRLAEQNANRLSIGNIEFRHGDWLQPLHDEQFMLIVSNPPYIAADDPHLQQGDLRFEPRQALVAGVDGLAALRTIVAGAGASLIPGGWLLLEHGFNQGQQLDRLLRHQGFTRITQHRDNADITRVVCGQWP